jgi:flagellar biosynthesis/type III secretory pathway M-ring protein FliF/YscJ
MLDEMEDELEKAEGNLTYVTKKTQELIKKSGGKRNCILIACLIVLVIILLFLIMYA